MGAVADIRVHIDTLEYTRSGLKTREPISLQVGEHNRVVLVRPARAPAFAASYACFASGSSFPGPAFLSLLLHEHQLGAGQSTLEDALATGQLRVFAHTDPSGSEAANKDTADRRATAARALLCADLDTLLNISSAEGWGTPLDQLMLRCLACDPGPIDGKHQELTEAATLRFQEQYIASRYHRPADALFHPDLKLDGRLGERTFEALLDAYVHHFSPRLPPSQFLEEAPNGCAAFNLATEDTASAANRRVSLAVHTTVPAYPDSKPCTEGNTEVCPIVPTTSSRASCMWYREHVDDPPAQTALHYNFLPSWLPLNNGRYMLSVVTTALDGEEIHFEVFGSEDRVGPPSLRPARVVDDWGITRVAVPAKGGVAQVVWEPPPDFAPGTDGRSDGVVPGFAATHDRSKAATHASYPANVITLLLSANADDFEGKLVLSDSTGKQAEFTSENAQPYDDAHDAFRFETASIDELYTLVHEREDSPSITYFEQVPFRDLDSHGESNARDPRPDETLELPLASETSAELLI